MSDVTSIASALLSMSQFQIQDQINMSILKMDAKAQVAVADMLMENARQIQALSSSSSNLIDLFI